MIKKRLLIISSLIVTFFLIGCVYGQQAFYRITSQSMIANDGSSITAEEREMIRALLPFFVAITNKDAKTMRKIHPAIRNMTDEQLVSRFATVKNYTFHGLESVSFNGQTLKARAIYSAEVIIPRSIGKNIADFQTDVGLIREGDTWVISEWNQIRGNGTEMEYFQDIFARIANAEKRYGVNDLSKWNGL